MGTPAPEIPQQPPLSAASTPTGTPKHGTTAQFFSAAFAGCAVGIAILGVIWHYSAQSAATTDQQIKGLITEQIKPLGEVAKDEHINSLIGKQLDPLNEKVDKIARDVAYLKGKAGVANTKLDKSINPDKALSDIRVSLEQARHRNIVLPDPTLTEYRKKVQTLPTSATDYWATVAAIINYQSYVNQTENKAPNPLEVAKPCLGVTKGPGDSGNVIDSGNLIQGWRFTACVVDLDGTQNEVEGAVFENSVIRWHGGPVTIKSATFINCRFVIDIKTEPVRPDLLKQLLASDQTYFTLTAAG